MCIIIITTYNDIKPLSRSASLINYLQSAYQSFKSVLSAGYNIILTLQF